MDGSGRKSCITPEGARRLAEEHDRLWNLERPRVTREVADAAALGDRSENAEYIYGKRRLREIDARLRFLRKRLDELVVVQPGEVRDRSRVFFGAWVTLELEDGAVVRYRLVGPDESDVERGLISIESPLGRGLVGRTRGEEVNVRRPAGLACYRVREIEYDLQVSAEP
jgi:transcription elongation factor GreB